MFERFTTQARAAVTVAQDEARALHDRQIGTEHLLIGLAGPGADAAAVALRGAGLTAEVIRARLRRGAIDEMDPVALASLGINLDEVRRAAELRFGIGALDPAPKGPEPKGHIPFSAGAKKCLELAVREAARQRGLALPSGAFISSGHVLIGVIDEGRGGGVTVLLALGIDLAALRSTVLAQLDQEAA